MIEGFGLAVLVTVIVLCECARPIGRVLAVIDRPDNVRKVHSKPTPLVGGLALVPALAIAAAYGGVTAPPEEQRVFVAVLVALAGFSLIGFLDDRSSLAPVQRLLSAVVLFGVVMLVDPGFVLSELDFGAGLPVVVLGPAAVPFTLLCTIGLLNAVNMADGKNGLVLSLAIFWIYSLRFYAPPHLVTFLDLAGLSTIVLFIYNRFGRLFLGDSGSYAIGALVGLLAIHVYNHPATTIPVTIVILWFAVPVLDCLRVMLRRLRAGRSPFSADADHLHHLLTRGRSWRQGFLLYLAVACGPGLLAMAWPNATNVLVAVAIGSYAVLLWLAGTPGFSDRLTHVVGRRHSAAFRE